jgi:hypothetical protein
VKALKFYQNPGHAWIAVPSEALALVGLSKNDFTAYSHQSRTGTMLYLEEDCDATKFVEAFERKFGCKPYLLEQHTNHRHWIRSLPALETTRS